jgi:hypothetical protein
MGDLEITPAAMEPTEDVDVSDEEAITVTHGVINAADQRFFQRVVRFLTTVQAPSYWGIACREGYSPAEHLLGWKYLRLAGGEVRTMGHLAEELGERSSESDEQNALLQQLDAFENLWFPRMRGIIRREVPRDLRDQFAAAFFKDLDQQPLGPSVVRSVSTFITRVEGLASSSQPGANEVVARLRERGLTRKRLQRMKSLLAEIEAPGAMPTTNLTAEQVAQVQAEQREGLIKLRDWFNDWGITLRPVFSARTQVRLGLTVITRDKDKEEVEDAPPPPPIA